MISSFQSNDSEGKTDTLGVSSGVSVGLASDILVRHTDEGAIDSLPMSSSCLKSLAVPAFLSWTSGLRHLK